MVQEFVIEEIKNCLEGYFISFSPSHKEGDENKGQIISRFEAWASDHIEYIDGVVAGLKEIKDSDAKLASRAGVVVASRFMYDLMLGKA